MTANTRSRVNNNNNNKYKTYIAHIPSKYVHMRITDDDNTVRIRLIRITNWQEFKSKKLRMSRR